MLNAATLIIGLVVLTIVIFSAYCVYKSVRGGGCGACGGCHAKSRPECGQCQKKNG